uniref:NADH-ubiquinone oxidoreductase chain 1 n=1 Tax=Linguatula arctica TaxID=1346601 RepID=A0A7G8QC99_9CRUS|nr:NADH dehydrogenase subunit 1 [Linguatula arctica]QNK04407.1 NADH dehydrogenase subunit 1 [Linguatula arctica]
MILFLLQSVMVVGVGMAGLAFVTLMERKMLGVMQYREGPNKVAGGYLQPVADAVKLVSKGGVGWMVVNMVGYYVGPVILVSLMVVCWVLFPSEYGISSMSCSLLGFILILSLSVYGLLVGGWMSNSKYGLIGAMRSVAQTISYEVSLVLVVMFWVLFMGSYMIEAGGLGVYFFMVNGLVFGVLMVICVAEVNRSPFDFSEGESELVSGFNVEYGSLLFVFIFMSEYGFVVFWSVLVGWMYLGGLGGVLGGVKVVGLSLMILWWRGVLPRFRYDKLMGLAWDVMLYVVMWSYLLGVGMVSGMILS